MISRILSINSMSVCHNNKTLAPASTLLHSATARVEFLKLPIRFPSIKWIDYLLTVNQGFGNPPKQKTQQNTPRKLTCFLKGNQLCREYILNQPLEVSGEIQFVFQGNTWHPRLVGGWTNPSEKKQNQLGSFSHGSGCENNKTVETKNYTPEI